MTHPGSEPSRQQRVNQAAAPQVELFSHPPQAEASKQHPPLAARGHCINWKATPFSSGAADKQRYSLLIEEDDRPPGRQR